MDQVTATQTAQIPQFRGTSRAQMDFIEMEARQRAANPKMADQNFDFGDFIDMINPLQHLPIVGNMYREATGDQINPAMKIAGAGIFGGPLGLIGGLVSAIYEQASGEEIESTIAGWMGNDPASTAVAAKTAAPQEEIKLADIQWNNTKAVGFGMAAATPLRPEPQPQAVAAVNPAAAAANAQTVAAAEPAKPTAMFEGLQKGIMPASYSPPPQIPAYFNPNTAQFHGVQPAAAKTPAAAPAVAANDTVQQPQSDFAKKMMEALDRYETAKVAR